MIVRFGLAVILAFFLMSFQSAFGVAYGVKAGVGKTKLEIETGDWRYGPIGNAFTEAQLSEYVALELSVRYMQRGVKLTFVRAGEVDEAQGESADDYYADYIDLPINLKFFFVSGNVRPYLAIGPFISVLLGKRTWLDRPRTAMIGGTLALGVEKTLGKKRAVLLEMVCGGDLSNTFENSRWTNRLILFQLGLKVW